MTDGSITNALAALDRHTAEAAQQIWDRYFAQLCEYAESRIYHRYRRHVSSDEIAADAFLALLHGLQEKKFHQVRNRDELWQMLTLIAARLVIKAQRHHGREKRGGGRVKGNSAFGDSGINSVADYVQREITPEAVVELRELAQRLLQLLPSNELRQVAVWRMAGYSNAEIANQLQCAERTVERKLNLIRKTWTEFEGLRSDYRPATGADG